MLAKMIHNYYVKPSDKLNYSRSLFNYSRTHSTNLLTGYIVPVAYIDCLPGTTVPNKFGFVLQSAPLLGPSVDNVYIDIVSVWCPTRLVMANFNEWLGDNDTYAWTLGNNIHYPKISYLSTGSHPGDHNMSKTYYAEHFLAPHIGCRWWFTGDPTDVTAELGTDFSTEFNSASRFVNGINVIPSRMYSLIWNRIFRNENIQNPLLFSKQSGSNISLDVTNYGQGLGKLHRANRLKNIFTTAWIAPSIQTVDILSGISAPVQTGATHSIVTSTSGIKLVTSSNTSTSGNLGLVGGFVRNDTTATFSGSTAVYPNNLWAQLSGLTVNSLYYSIMLQRYLNKSSEGRRMVEFYKIHFGIDKSNAAYDDPELLSQKRYKVNISRVVATANSTDSDGNLQGLGTQGAFSVTSVGGVLFPEFTATEYGMLWVFAVIRTQPSLASGIDRYLSHHDLLSTYLPEFDHIGYDSVEFQEVANGKPFTSGSPAVPNLEIFGYKPAWYNYRETVNDAVGIFSPGEALDYMTLARSFDNPNSHFTISNSFIVQSAAEFDRMLQLPVAYLTPGDVDSDGLSYVDAYGEPLDSDRYQWVIQFALAGDLAVTMSKDSEPLLFGQKI